MNKHTPTPWVALEPNQFGDVTITQDGESAELVAIVNVDIMRMFDKQEEFTANTAFIVKAVNAHEALVEALETVLASFKHGDDSGSALYIDDDNGELAEMVATTLALAKGGE